MWLLPETAGEGWARVREKWRQLSAGNYCPVLTCPIKEEKTEKRNGKVEERGIRERRAPCDVRENSSEEYLYTLQIRKRRTALEEKIIVDEMTNKSGSLGKQW